MGSWQYRFYSVMPQAVFETIGERWPTAIVRRHAWQVGGSDIWYVTIALDELDAASAFERWLGENSRRMNISYLVGRYDGWTDKVVHPRLGLLATSKLYGAAFKRRWRR